MSSLFVLTSNCSDCSEKKASVKLSVQSSVNLIVPEFQTTCGINISTKIVSQELHGITFHGQATPVDGICTVYCNMNSSENTKIRYCAVTVFDEFSEPLLQLEIMSPLFVSYFAIAIKDA